MGNYVKTPTVFQMEAAECGAASLAMIMAFYGKHPPLEQLREKTGVSRDGCRAGDLIRAARRYGFECHGYRKKVGGLKTIATPCIIHWENNHFVVFEGFKGNRAYINDPASGRRRLTLGELDECFSGIALTFKPTGEFTEDKKQKSTLWRFAAKQVFSERRELTKLLLLGIPLSLLVVVPPVLARFFVDEVIINGNPERRGALIAAMLAAALLQIGLSVLRSGILERLKKKIVLYSARDFLAKMFRLPMGFFERRYVGDLLSRVSANANVGELLSGGIAEMALNVFSSAACLVMLLIYSPVLTAAAVIAVLLNALIGKLTASIMSNDAERFRRSFGKLTGTVCAGLGIADALRASGAENEYTSRILGCSARTDEFERRLTRCRKIGSALSKAAAMFFCVTISFAGGVLVINGAMTIGGLTAFVLLFGALLPFAGRLSRFAVMIRTSKADISRVEDIASLPEDAKFGGEAEKSDMTAKLAGRVELRNITFGYTRSAPPIVSGLNIRLGCGDSTALVGASGSGRSTVAKLIGGLYEPWTGELLFDGIPAKSIPNAVLSASVSTVSRKTTLFSGTVRDNLTMWNSGISEEDMIAAAKDACIHDVISQKPGAYDSRLTEGGFNLSGGQRQRLGIARALVTNPTVLIMDEATSALDPATEKQIMDNIKRRGCTCIVIAHRLSAVRGCGEIVVMENGGVVQRGTHEVLAKTDGLYRTLTQND